MSHTGFTVNLHPIVWLNVKKLLDQSKHHISSLSDSNKVRTHSHLIHKQKLNSTQLAKLTLIQFKDHGSGREHGN